MRVAPKFAMERYFDQVDKHPDHYVPP